MSTRSIGAVPITSAKSRNGVEPGRTIAHENLPGFMLLCGTKLRIVREPGYSLDELPTDIHEQPRAGRAVMPTSAQRLKQRVAREFRHKIAGEAANSPEGRRAGAGGSGRPL